MALTKTQRRILNGLIPATHLGDMIYKLQIENSLLYGGFRDSVGHNAAGLVIGQYKAIWPLKLQDFQVYARSVTATASVDLQVDGVSILSAAVTPVAEDTVQGILTDLLVSAGQKVQIVVTTDGSGALSDLQAILTFAVAD